MRQHAEPVDVETVANQWFNRPGLTDLPKMLEGAGLAPSRTEAERLLKAGAVEIDSEPWKNFTHHLRTFTVRAGKKWKRIG